MPLNLTEYKYDPNGNREEERINRPTGAQVTTYGYDAADRLKSTRRVEGVNTVATEWTYDLADNRLTETVASTGEGAGTVSRVYRYDERNQLRGITDSALGATTLDYDPQGNLKQKARGSDTTTFEWSARDLLVSVSRNGTLLGRYGSDHAGLRVHKEAADPLQPGEAARVLRTQWDDQNAVQDRDAGGSVVARYDFAGGQPVAMWSATDGAQVLHADALGSVVATTATDGTVKSETLYDAWGTPLLKTGSSANKFAYTGHQADAETGLYYFKARYFDPETGRFISVDPAEGQDARPASYHKYLYAYGNPLVYTDPTGRYSFRELGDELVYTSGMVAGLSLAVATSAVDTAKSLYEMNGEITLIQRGDPDAIRRSEERWEALRQAATNFSFGDMVDRFKTYVNREESGALREQADGNMFTAGVVRGRVVGEVASSVLGGPAITKGSVVSFQAATRITAKTPDVVNVGTPGQPTVGVVDSAGISPRLTRRLDAWRAYQDAGGQLGLQRWVEQTQGAPWGTGFKSGFANWSSRVDSPHGNSLLSDRPATLYKLYSDDGTFLKWGVSQDMDTRYSGSFMADKQIFQYATGTRSEMLKLERNYVETEPGPLNFERWAGSRSPN